MLFTCACPDCFLCGFRSEEVRIELPDPPTLSVLAYNNKTKSSAGLQSLATPAKVLTQWHDSSFSAEFREFLKDKREALRLDLVPKTAKGETSNDDPNPRPGKKARTASTPDPVPIATDDFIDVGEIQSPLTHEAVVCNNSKLTIAVTVGHGCFLINQTGDVQSCKAGTVLAGYYKGKFESLETMPDGPDLVLFTLTGSSNAVLMNGKLMKVGELINIKRQTNPGDATVSFHELTDTPKPSDPKAFTLKMKPKIFLAFRAQPFPTKTEAEGDNPLKIPSVHMAGALPSSAWSRCRFASMLWAMKWPPVASKGLQPVRPMVVNLDNINVPPGKALCLVAPDS